MKGLGGGPEALPSQVRLSRRQGVDAVLGGAKPRLTVTVDERLSVLFWYGDVELSTPSTQELAEDSRPFLFHLLAVSASHVSAALSAADRPGQHDHWMALVIL